MGDEQSSEGRVRERVAESTRGRSGKWIARLTRFGYATRGVIFTLVGVLAAQVAFGLGGQPSGTRGALLKIGQQPFGQILLGITTLGLAGYVLWRFIQAVLDPVHGGKGTVGTVRRLAYFISGLFYSLLAFTAAQLTLGLPGAREGEKEEWTAWALNLPLGAWLVGLVGAVLIGVGLHALYRSIWARFMDLYHAEALPAPTRQVVLHIGQIGLAALGLTLCIIGGFVIRGAVQANPRDAIGIGGALQRLGGQPHGPWLMGLVAVGFVVYGLHCFALARYRKIQSATEHVGR